jgi:hypothetical protein
VAALFMTGSGVDGVASWGTSLGLRDGMGVGARGASLAFLEGTGSAFSVDLREGTGVGSLEASGSSPVPAFLWTKIGSLG